MSKITFTSGDITEFRGDAIICPSFTDLKENESSQLLSNIHRKAGNLLYKELSAVDYCHFGNTIITKAYLLKVHNLIFLPYRDYLEGSFIDFIELNQAFKNALNLANLYNLKTIATIDPTNISKYNKKEYLYIITSLFKRYTKEMDKLVIYQSINF